MKALWIIVGWVFLMQPASAQTTSSSCDSTPSCVTDLANVVDAMANGSMPFIGNAAATATQRMDQAHDKLLEERGYGLYYGNKLTDVDEWPGVLPQDCTTFVLEILKQAYKAAGMEDEWNAVFAEAVASSGSTGFKGIELMKALQKSGWSGHYWNPDVKNPSDSSDEHPWSYHLAKKNGSYYGLPVDMERAIIDYRLTDGEGTTVTPGLEALRDVPFAVLAARGGRHMGVVVYGKVYDVHWSERPTSKDVITDEPLEDWAWLSGAVVIPPGTWPASGGGS